MTITPDASAADAGDPKEPSRLAQTSDGGSKMGGAVHEFAELAKTIVYALLIAFVLRVVLFQPFTIPSESMEPNLLKGDYIIVSKFAYGWSRHSIPWSPPLPAGRFMGHQPRRGDIVVFKLPRDGKTDYIKRLIGMPGDRIQVTHGQVSINGAPVKRTPTTSGMDELPDGMTVPVTRFVDTLPNGKSFINNSYSPDGPADNTGVYVVPKGCYFMMGDNRDNSADSRFNPGDVEPGQSSCAWNSDNDHFVGDGLGVGFVPFDDLVGRADIILFSWKPGVSLLKPWTWLTEARWDRFFHLLG